MYSGSTVSLSDAVSAVEMFEQGFTAKSVAMSLYLVGSPAQMLYFEIKLEIVRRHVRGESGRALAEEYGLPSPNTVATWTGIYRREGEDGLLPKRRGRPPTDHRDSPPKSEIETLRSENERLSAEVA